MDDNVNNGNCIPNGDKEGDDEKKDHHDNKNAQQTQIKSEPFSQKIMFVVRNVTVEPVVLLLGLTMALAITITPSFLVNKICLATLLYSDEVCQNLTGNTTLEQEAQNLAATLNMIKTIIETIPSVIFILFLGPWSDRFGRKKTIAFPAIGGSLSMGLLLIIAYFKREVPPELVLVAALAQSLAGGILGVVSIAGSYISDITPPDSRTNRLAILQVAYTVAAPLGSGLCGVIFEYLGGFVTVFGIGFVLNILTLLYVIFVVKETVIISPADKKKNQFLAFFNLKNVQNSYKTVIKKREKNQRTHLWLVFGISALYMLTAMGEVSVLYLYLRWRFFMSEMMFSIFIAVILIVDSIGLTLVPFFTGFCRIPTNVLGMMSGISRILLSLVLGLSTKIWMIFASCTFVLLLDGYMPVTRGIMSQCVTPQEQGKVFSILAALESAAPALGTIICTQLYNGTMQKFPGAVFLLTASVNLLPLAMMSYLALDRRRYNWKMDETEMKTAIA